MQARVRGQAVSRAKVWASRVAWFLAGVGVLAATLKLHWAIPAADVCMAWLLLGTVLLALERTQPLQMRRIYQSPHVNFILFVGILISAVGVVESRFLVNPTGNPAAFAINLLPYSDASGYFTGARSLLEFGVLDEWCSRRPTASIFYGILYALAGQDLGTFYVVVAITLSIVMLLAAHEICSSWGLAAAACFCALVFGFYSRTAGTFMSESVGLIMGVLALSALVRGFSRNDFWLSCAGVCILALAVLTRAGALFAVPLVAAQLLIAHHRSLSMSLRNGMRLAACLSVFLGCIYLAARLVVAPGATFQGNFSYTLYGLAVGGKGWGYVLTERAAELRGLSDGQASNKVYELAFAKIHEEPSLLLKTLWDALTSKLLDPIGLFYPFSPGFSSAVWFLPLILAVGVLIVARPARRYPSFLLFGGAGVVLSAPFLADGGPRVLAATVPLVAALACFGIAQAAGIAQYPPSVAPSKRDFVGMAPVLLLLGLLVLAPAVFRLTGNHTLTAPKDADEHVVKFEPTSGVLVVADDTALLGRRDRKLSELRGQRAVRKLNLASQLKVGSFLANSLDLTGPSYFYLLFDQEPPFDRTVRLRVRGKTLGGNLVHVTSAEAF